MSLNKEFFNRETNISAKVIADSVNENGVRITTLEVEAPRIILAEINTHNAISKNCSSSRAIPISKMLDQIEKNGFTPLKWGGKKSGMQSGGELTGTRLDLAKKTWCDVRDYTIQAVRDLDVAGLHKEVSNRLTEPFQMVKQVLTATDWDNFLNLRLHKDAQPEICMLAYKIYRAISESTPNKLRDGEYHLPYVEISQDQYDLDNTYYFTWDKDVSGTETDGYMYEKRLSLDDAIKVSASCCAQVSYRNTDMSIEKADKIFNMLVKADVLHASCFEHIATPIRDEYSVLFDPDDDYTLVECNIWNHPDSWDDGITHMNRKGELCSANFRGWIQYRHILKGNTCWDFDYDERMKSFN